jgi:hypothetical protein
LELVFDASSSQTVGLRFKDIDIPPGASVLNASVQFTVDETDSGATDMTIRGEDTDNAPVFTTSTNNISNRSTTAASVIWEAADWTGVGDAGVEQQTPNLAAIIQEIIDRPGWTANNSLVIIMNGSGERTAESYDGSPAGAPVLNITFDLNGNRSPAPPLSFDRTEMPEIPSHVSAQSDVLQVDSLAIDNTDVDLEIPIEVILKGNTLRLFPNPVRSQLNVHYLSVEGQDAFIELLDQTGRKLFYKNVDTKKGKNVFQIILGHLPSGLYYLRINESGKQLAKKVVISN